MKTVTVTLPEASALAIASFLNSRAGELQYAAAIRPKNASTSRLVSQWHDVHDMAEAFNEAIGMTFMDASAHRALSTIVPQA